MVVMMGVDRMTDPISVLTEILQRGVTISLVDGRLKLTGLKGLTPVDRDHVLLLATEHKAGLMVELAPVPDTPPRPDPARPGSRRKPATTWPAAILEQIRWLEIATLPERFGLHCHGPNNVAHVSVTNGELFRRDLLKELSQGPKGPRNSNGAVLRDLEQLYRLFGQAGNRRHG